MKNKTSIRWKIQNYLILFIISTLVILWVFQVVFLDDFYRVIKTREVKSFAASIQREYEKGSLNNITVDAEMYAYIINSQGSVIARPERPFYSPAQEISSIVYRAIFNSVSNKSGLIIDMDDFGIPKEGLSISTLTYAYRMDDSAMVVIQAQIAPVSATVRTIQVQLMIVSLMLIGIASILARTMYKRISAPMIEINESAKILATGNYNEPFKGQGYKEIEELADTLNATRHELAKVETMRNELIANVSHDLRTPLTMITGYAELMKDIPEEISEENLDIILNEAKYLNNLVQELLDLSKLQSNSQQLTKEKFDLIEEVAALIKRLENLYPNREVEYHGPKSLLIKEDKSQINQVLYNLINNALNYSEDKVGISIDVMNNKARVSVWDEGPGLAEEELSKIWTRYYRSDNDHKRMVHGTGIGLSIVKNIFENNSIDFGVKNRESQGLEFWFDINCINQKSK